MFIRTYEDWALIHWRRYKRAHRLTWAAGLTAAGLFLAHEAEAGWYAVLATLVLWRARRFLMISFYRNWERAGTSSFVPGRLGVQDRGERERMTRVIHAFRDEG